MFDYVLIFPYKYILSKYECYVCLRIKDILFKSYIYIK